MTKGFVYELHVGELIYVGSTVDAHHRERRHMRQLKNRQHEHSQLNEVFNGTAEFVVKHEIEFDDISELRHLENQHAVELKSDGANVVNSPEKGTWAEPYGHHHTSAAKQAIAEKNRKENLTAETLKRRSDALTGRKWTDEQRARAKGSRTGETTSDEVRAKISKSLKGKAKSAEHIARVAQANTGKKREVKQCPHCGKTGGGGVMARWHFDRCRHRNVAPEEAMED